MSFDPERYGAQCSICPLREAREGGPVPNEWPDRPIALLVGEAPGENEVKKGAPFIGRAGLELMQGLGAVGIRRSQVALSNVVLCRPPENKYDRLVHQIQKENKKRDAEGLDLIPTPAQCCRPRLVREIAALPKVIALGSVALHATVGHGSIMESRGGPREVSIESEPGTIVQARVLPALHPSFVMRSRRWRGAFRADLGRAFRWFSSGLAWRDPSIIYIPRPSQLRAFLYAIRSAPLSVFDVETFAGFPDHFEPMEDRLKCIGIGVADGRTCVIPFRSVEAGVHHWYTPAEQTEIVKLLVDYLTSPDYKKAGWNSRYYDRIVVESRLGVIPTPHLDGIMVHRVAEPELPHNLGYTGSIHTDVDKWKAGHAGTKAASDKELWDYNAKDCVVTAMAIPALVQVARDRKQDHLIPVFHRLQDVCVGLHQNGLPVNQQKRREWDKKLLAQADAHRKKIRELANAPNLNPASFPQIADLLFERIGIAPHHYTELGDPSTDDDALRAFLSDTWGLDPKRQALVTAIRDFRRVSKRRGVVVRLRPINEEAIIAEDLIDYSEDGEGVAARGERIEEERARAKKGKARAPGLVLPDGRVHADWNPHGTCVDAATWVITDRGPSRIGDIAGWGSPGTNRPATFLLHDGDALRGVTRQVNVPATAGRAVETVLGIRLVGANGHRVQVADRPRFRVSGRDGGKPIEPDPIWKRLDELTPHDYVRVRIGMNAWASYPPPLPIVATLPSRTNANPISLPREVTEDLAFFAGAYNADGCFHDSNGSFGILITCRIHVERRPAIRAACERLFGLAAVGEDKDGIRVTSISLRDWVDLIGLKRGLPSKRTPSWLFQSPRRIVEAYLRGLALDASVHVHGDGIRWRYVGSPALTDEVHALLLNMGIVASRHNVGERPGRAASFEVLATGEDAAVLCHMTGKLYEPPLHPPRQQTHPRFIRRGNTLWLRVRSNVSVPDQNFLDVTVPETACFWANGTISHNTGWRFSSSNPNLQNLEDKLRDMFVAPPGYVFVACDEAQLELRMVAGLAGCKYYIDRFREKSDPHKALCIDVFSDRFLQASPDHQKKLRRCMKELTYSSLYGAEDRTKLEVVTSAEDEDETLLFPDFTLREVSAFSSAWTRRNPEIPEWWESLAVEQAKQGFLAEPIMGLKCDFLDGPGSEGFLNRLYNYKAQSGGSALVHLATFRVLDQIPFRRWGPGTGLVQQGHDSLVLQIPADHDPWRRVEKKGRIVETWCEENERGERVCGCRASQTARLLEEAMTEDGRRYGMDMDFVGEAKIGRTLKSV